MDLNLDHYTENETEQIQCLEQLDRVQSLPTSNTQSVGWFQKLKNAFSPSSKKLASQNSKRASNATSSWSSASMSARPVAPAQHMPSLNGFIDPHKASMEGYNYTDDDPVTEQTDQITAKKATKETTSEGLDLEKAVNLSIRLKHTTITSSSFTDQTLPMLVSLSAATNKSVKKAPIDLICVIDRSGSMYGEKIELAKKALCSLLEFMESSDRISILVFDHAVERICPLLCATAENKQKIIAQVKRIQATGANDINLGLMHAFRTLEQRRTKNPIQSIFLLSDGIEDGAYERVQVSLQRMKVPTNITISTFGFGNDHDSKLLTNISDTRDGNFYFIRQLDTIDEAFVDCLGGLVSSVAQNVQINIMPHQSEQLRGVQIAKAYGDASMWTQDKDTYITKMACLISGVQKDYVLELKLPASTKELADNDKHVPVAKAHVMMTGLDGQKVVKEVTLSIMLLNEGEMLPEGEAVEDDRDVMKHFYRVKGALVMSEARQLADQGQYDTAKQRLVAFKEEVENSLLKEDAFIQNLVKDLTKAMEDVNPVVYQDYGRHNMCENEWGQMKQKSNLKAANCYQNSLQSEWVEKVKSKKH